MVLEAQVRRATVTSSRRAGVFNEGRAASLEKKYQGPAIASRREAVTRFVTGWKKKSRASSRRGL